MVGGTLSLRDARFNDASYQAMHPVRGKVLLFDWKHKWKLLLCESANERSDHASVKAIFKQAIVVLNERK